MPTARYDKSKTSTRAYDWANGQKVAIGAAEADSAAIDAIEVMLRPDVRCFVTVGAGNPVAANAAGSIPIEAGESFHLQVNPGDKVSVIRASGDGSLYILPVA